MCKLWWPKMPALMLARRLWRDERGSVMLPHAHGIMSSVFIPVPATVSFTASAVNAAAQSSYTFSAVSIGTAAPDRKVVVALMSHDNPAGVTAMTIGGVSASLVIAEEDSGGNANCEIWQANVPTGTTADIVVTATTDGCGIGVWAVYGAASAAHATAGSENGTTFDLSLNVPANGVAIAAGSMNTATSFAWAGLTEDFDEVMESSVIQTGASAAFATAQTPQTITATRTGGSGVQKAGAAASWGPA